MLNERTRFEALSAEDSDPGGFFRRMLLLKWRETAKKEPQTVLKCSKSGEEITELLMLRRCCRRHVEAPACNGT